ncbi:hypothetical protein [Elizabethkingia ursingii]
MRKTDAIYSAVLVYNNIEIISLIRPKLYEKKGLIKIDCFLDSTLFEFSDHYIFKNHPTVDLGKGKFKLKAITKQGSVIEFFEVLLTYSSYPSYSFTFTCYFYSLQYANVDHADNINYSMLSSFVVDGFDFQYTRTSQIVRQRNIFNKDDTSTLSINFDTIELPLNLWYKKRHFDFQIAIIKNPSKANSAIVRFIGDSLLPYRIYEKIKFSIKYFISYLVGNNIIIKEESFHNNKYGYFIKSYSEKRNKKILTNEYLPVYDAVFRHKYIAQDYIETISLYLYLDKKIKLSEIIYLINQAKKVDVESSFFILVICIEKLSRLLVESDLIPAADKTIVSKELFDTIKKPLLTNFEKLCGNSISKNELSIFKSKIHNLNVKGKTDYKIDMLLEFAEIERTDEVRFLFPFLRNLAIHEGEISTTDNGHYENYFSLFNLVNEIICNLIQYKGIRRPKSIQNSKILIKKKKYIINYKDKIGFVNHQ